MDVVKELDYLRSSADKLEKADLLKFEDFIDKRIWRSKRLSAAGPKVEEILDKLGSAGCYIIYDEKKPIYVGQASRRRGLRDRMLNDLFSHEHSFRYKLEKELGSKENAQVFLYNKCFRFVTAESDTKATAIEGFFIMLLSPKYNREIIRDTDAKLIQ